MDDPFPEAQAEASQALANSQQLFESYMRIKSTLSSSSSKGSSSEELSYAEAELKGTLSVLHADVNDLEEAVEAAERHGPEAFGLSLATIQERRRFVLGIREAMDDIRSAMKKGRPLSFCVKNSDDIHIRRSSFRDAHSSSPDLEYGRSDSAAPQPSAYDMQQQQFIMDQQDTTLTSLGSVVGTLRSQAMSVGGEVMDQVSMLGSLNTDIDRSQNRLAAAQQKMNTFLRETRSSKSSCCIVVLIIVLCVLLVVAFVI